MNEKTDMSPEGVTHRLRQMEGLWLLSKALGKSNVVSKKESSKNRGLEIQAAIRHVLNTDWNPISVRDGGVDDEYDAYIAPIYRILVTSREPNQIVKTLMRIESDELGVEPSDAAKYGPIAEALLKLDVMLK